ncbi:hypothetical protein L6452_38051 [Arctium lappa]|uniref:Uncharacterized protein n=1 Tax=Arctium lappa TaxID=4217 RepID=A0ACB8Y662_ARCLA|nr:hypothetical protein L6452_38051 [Arctium lappa]
MKGSPHCRCLHQQQHNEYSVVIFGHLLIVLMFWSFCALNVGLKISSANISRMLSCLTVTALSATPDYF